MILFCASCNRCVANVKPSSWDKGTIALCKSCWERYKLADDMAKLAAEQGRNFTSHDAKVTPDKSGFSAPMPDFMRDFFHANKSDK